MLALALLGVLLTHRRSVGALNADIEELKRENARFARDGILARTEGEQLRALITQGRTGPEAPPDRMPPAILRGPYGGKINQLIDYLVDHPERSIPELQYLWDQDWVQVAGDNSLDSEDDLRFAVMRLRQAAKDRLAPRVSEALKRYVEANDEMLPDDPRLLAPYFHPPVSEELLTRYRMTITGNASNRILGTASLPVLVERTWVDDIYDSRMSVGLGQWGQIAAERDAAFTYDEQEAIERWRHANPDRPLSSLTDRQELVSFFDSSVDQEKLKKWLEAPPRLE